MTIAAALALIRVSLWRMCAVADTLGGWNTCASVQPD
jgi:hypothetical protein